MSLEIQIAIGIVLAVVFLFVLWFVGSVGYAMYEDKDLRSRIINGIFWLIIIVVVAGYVINTFFKL